MFDNLMLFSLAKDFWFVYFGFTLLWRAIKEQGFPFLGTEKRAGFMAPGSLTPVMRRHECFISCRVMINLIFSAHHRSGPRK